MSDEKNEVEWVLDLRPVTIRQWLDVMGSLPDERLRERDPSTPVVFVSAIEADEYARRIGGRLPTDSELEHAFAQRTVARIRPVVWEWTSTAGGSSRVSRGGWIYGNADDLPASYRSASASGDRYYDIGLRCASQGGS